MGAKQQLSFSDYELTTAKKQTKREKFVCEVEAFAPWQALIDLNRAPLPQSEQERWPASLSAGHDVVGPSLAAVVLFQRLSI